MGELQKFKAPELQQITQATVESVIIQGDLKTLKPEERVQYYGALCKSLNLNPLTRPFEYLQLNGKLQLYALKSCTEQLRQIHNVSITIAARESVEGCYVVTARAALPNGRQDESIGAVGIEGLKGEHRANAMMKAETKAKRRVTLSICGLAYMDETEMDAVRGASHVPVDHDTGEIPDPAPAATLTEDIRANPQKSSTPFNALAAFASLKKRFKALDKGATAYYTILGKWGVEKSNQFPATQQGLADARGCYKELSLAIQELEFASKIPEVAALPDPIPLVLGAKVCVNGVVWEVYESNEGQDWREVK